MKHIPSPFQQGDTLKHPRHGFGTVVKVEVYPQSADIISVLYLGGIDQFLAGSVASREWERLT